MQSCEFYILIIHFLQKIIGCYKRIILLCINDIIQHTFFMMTIAQCRLGVGHLPFSKALLLRLFCQIGKVPLAPLPAQGFSQICSTNNLCACPDPIRST